ncbi:MAG TPA: DUF3306 domain-containing protein [Paucimonas sp.]|nr:DUF3306 domain-containing protein [Paucimonas sp.]
MDADSFFARWSRQKAQAAQREQMPAAIAPVAQPEPQNQPPPTLDDVARLTPDSDFTPFVARGIDENVRRGAMKKLFADPHFNVMDGLDVYIGDYSKPDPIPVQMLAALIHAQALLDPLAHLDRSVRQLSEAPLPTGQEPEMSTAQPADTAAPDLPPADDELPAPIPVAALEAACPPDTTTHDDPI